MMRMLVLVMILGLGLTTAQASERFEAPPVRTASEILAPQKTTGPGYTIRETVDPRGYLNHFEIESKFGLYQVGSQRMLEVRLHEIETMDRLLKMGNTNAYLQALGKRLESLPNSLVQVATKPVASVKRVPQAATKTFGRVNSFFAGLGKKGSDTEISPEAAREALVASEKRSLAAELKVDVHSTNAKLQQLLDDVATARYAGEFTVSLASNALPGVGSVVYTTASTNTTLRELMVDKTDTELTAWIGQTLRNLGVHRYIAERFVGAPHLTLRHKTLIVTAMTKLKGVPGLSAIAEASIEAVDEARAFLQEEQALALASFHRDVEPIARLRAFGGIVGLATASGKVMVLGPIDLLWWSADTEAILDMLKQAPLYGRAGQRVLHIKGRVTQRIVDEAKARGITVISGWPWAKRATR